MNKKYYAGVNTYGTNFSYDSGWWAYGFNSKAERDRFVEDKNLHGYRDLSHKIAEPINRDIARKISGSRVQESALLDYDGFSLEVCNDYYNPNYWG